MGDYSPRMPKIELTLRQQLWAAQGRRDGFAFAVDCNGDVGRLTAEIMEREKLMVSLLTLPVSPMAPGANPRIYRDAYVAALKEAVQIVCKLGGEDVERPSTL